MSWGPSIALAAGTACALALLASRADDAVAGFRWVTCANTAIAGAAGIYLAYFWLGIERVGQAASMLAAMGAVGVPLGLLADAAQSASLRGAGSQFGLYEGTALFSAAAVFSSLAMEHFYRNRAGALIVLPAVLLAVLCEMWLIAQGLAAPGRPAPEMTPYWALGQRFTACLACAALAVAGACGARALLRAAEVPNGTQTEAIVGASAIGAPLLVIGTGMGVIWSAAADASGASDKAAGPGLTLPAMIAVLVLLAWARWRTPRPRRLAWLAVAAFAVALGGLVLGSLGIGLPS